MDEAVIEDTEAALLRVVDQQHKTYSQSLLIL